MEAEKFAENMDGNRTIIKSWPIKKQAAIGGSTIIKENNNIFNRFLLVSPSERYNTTTRTYLHTRWRK